MEYEQILFEVSDQIATITLNRPKRLNAYTPQMANEMWDALMKVENNPTLRVTIITGAGRGFCAGADLSSGGSTFNRTNQPGEEGERVRPEGTIIRRYLEFKKTSNSCNKRSCCRSRSDNDFAI